MSINSNSENVRSKYFTGHTDMDESLSDFQEAKKSCKGPKPAQKPAKPKTRKVTKGVKGQKDIRTALKGKKNELVTYSKEFDTVCKKSGLDVDSEQLQLAIALSKSLQTEPSIPETSQALSSQQRVAKIRKTLQEYGFKVPEAKITAGKKTKKYRKNYKLLTVTEEEKRQNITGKYTRILFENLDHSKVEQHSSNGQDPNANIFYIASNIPYECIKDNNIFYIDNLVEKSTTNGSLLRDWSEIPGRPESPKLIDTFIMNFKDIDCSQDELDIILSGSMKSVKDSFASKEIEFKKKYKECNVPKIVIEDEENTVSEDERCNVHQDGDTENKSPFQKGFNMESPVRMLDIRSPVKRLFEDKSLVSEEIEIISPIKKTYSSSIEVIDVETSNKQKFSQQYRSCSPDIFDDELSSIMETTKPIIVLSQEHKTKMFSQEIMDLTQCANIIPSQNPEKGIQLSQNMTKRRSNDFMEITDCIVGSSQPTTTIIREDLKEIDLTQSPEDRGAIKHHSINIDDNVVNVSTNFPNDAEQNATDSISQNITNEQQIPVHSNHPNTDSHQTAKENIDLTQSSNEDDKEIPIEANIKTPIKKSVDSMDLTQSSNSTDTSLPLVDIANSQSKASLDDTIIVDKDEYMAKGKVNKSLFGNEALSQVFDLTQAQNTSIEYNPSPVKVANKESCSITFYEDFVHDHSANTENSKEVEQNSGLSKEYNSSHNESKESNDIDLTQGSSSSEEILMSQRPVTVLQNIPNNSSLGKQDDISIDYDEIIIEDNINDDESFKESSLTQQYDSSKCEGINDIETVDENNDIDINSSQNSEVVQISDKELVYSLHKSRLDFPRDNFDFIKGTEKHKRLDLKYDSSESEVHNDIEIVDENHDFDINSSQNSELFHISDEELVYSFHKSRRDFSRDNFNFIKGSEKDKSLELKYDSSKSEIHNDIEIVGENNDIDINSSQNSEVFQISDEELEYSFHKSRRDFSRDNFDFIKGSEKDKSLELKYDSSKFEIHNDIEIVDVNNDIDKNSSQNSEVFQISDKELDYSLNKSTRDFQRDNFEFGGISVLYNVTKLGSYKKSLSEGCQPYFTENKNASVEDSFLPEVYVKRTEAKITETTQLEIDKAGGISPIKVQEVLKSNHGIFNIKTPKNSEYIIKTVDVTPMTDFASMSTPQRNRELDRYGLKPFKRKRAIQILTHLYNQTHPTIQQLVDEDQPSPSKKPKTNTYTQESSPQKLITSPIKSPSNTPVKSPRKFFYKKPSYETRLLDSPRKTNELNRNRYIMSAPSPIKPDELETYRDILSPPSPKTKASSKTPVKSPRKFVYKKPMHEARQHASPRKTDELERENNRSSATSSTKTNVLERDRDILSAPSSKTNEIKEVTVACGYEVISEVADVRSLDCSPDDWVFQKREKAKVHSCRVPLHIAFHNYVLSRRYLREAILKYEPVNIDDIHKDLVGYGHRYDPKDLLKFLDKKCITVKTTDNNARNNKR